MAGKLSGRVVAAAATNLGRPGRLALLVDVESNSSFLVDTGSVYSIIPHHSSDKPTGPAITTANGKPIQCWGTVVKTVTVGRTRFKWTFLLAAISFHIVGADFLENFGLMVDLRRRRLVAESGEIYNLVSPPAQSTFAAVGVRPATRSAYRPPARSQSGDLSARASSASPSTSASPSASPSTSASPSASPSTATTSSLVTGQGCGTGLREGVAVDAAGVGQDVQRTTSTRGGQQVDYQKLLLDFPAVTNLSKKLPTVVHKVLHHIETVGRPVSAKYRRLDAEKLAAAKAEFQELERQGIVRRSDSSWASPLHNAHG